MKLSHVTKLYSFMHNIERYSVSSIDVTHLFSYEIKNISEVRIKGTLMQIWKSHYMF